MKQLNVTFFTNKAGTHRILELTNIKNNRILSLNETSDEYGKQVEYIKQYDGESDKMTEGTLTCESDLIDLLEWIYGSL